MTWRPSLRLLPHWGWLLLVGVGCGTPSQSAHDGGQTGSASCGASPKCICDSVAGANVLRGVITLTNDTEARVEVLEVFGTSSLVLGDALTGPYQVGLPCGSGNLPALLDGAEVLVVASPVVDELPQNLYVVPWNTTLQLTTEFSLVATNASILTDATACNAEFPDKPVMCKGTF